MSTSYVVAKTNRIVWIDNPQAIPSKTGTRLNFSNWIRSSKAHQLACSPCWRNCHLCSLNEYVLLGKAEHCKQCFLSRGTMCAFRTLFPGWKPSVNLSFLTNIRDLQIFKEIDHVIFRWPKRFFFKVRQFLVAGGISTEWQWIHYLCSFSGQLFL